jgi:putative glycosyltransferase (TIGR04348 family)
LTRAHIYLVSPALADANNGNWRTAQRWARFLRTRYRVTLAREWNGADSASGNVPALMIALHARRSAPSLAAFSDAYAQHPTLLLLTGTDLYRDIHRDASAQEALRRASALVLLQADGLTELPAGLRAKASVIHQSATTLRPLPGADRPRRLLDVCMIGHLRQEKDPATFMRASALVTAPRIRMLHIGGALDPALGRTAEATAASIPRYHWLGALGHAAARQRLRRSHLMAICSTMEGGANVIIEAITSGVPVLASDISGNRGMLGNDYAGFFPPGDAAALAALIERSSRDPEWLAQLRAQCAARAPLFSPATEQAALLGLVDRLLASAAGCNPAAVDGSA